MEETSIQAMGSLIALVGGTSRGSEAMLKKMRPVLGLYVKKRIKMSRFAPVVRYASITGSYTSVANIADCGRCKSIYEDAPVASHRSIYIRQAHTTMSLEIHGNGEPRKSARGGRTVRKDGELQNSDSETEEPPDRSVKAILMDGLGLTEGECNGEGTVCSRGHALKLMAGYAARVDPDLDVESITQANPSELRLENVISLAEVCVDVVKSDVQCDSESCIYSTPEFNSFARENGFDRKTVHLMKEIMFKTKGPRDVNSWLSNVHIDNTLWRWAAEFTFFYPMPFAMMDFASTKHPLSTSYYGDILDGVTPTPLGPLGTVKRKNKCIGCVVNTDVSTGPGKHWVVAFIDCRGSETWTVEYFNSTGNNPPKPIVKWMGHAVEQLKQYTESKSIKVKVEPVVVTKVNHQKGDSECGVYSLFYIRRRLEGKSYTLFMNQEHKVVDQYMRDFRRCIFRHD